ncbi:uncharacterized protein K441DRAFT_653869 [Cenococcum geophilum 1.58]|uniref:uncharacterized protein n=1 Tax=Cenococcum geophilum 1.58 TaxID=794803 RepID=UPI00358E3202|nr:hypothetical protein K441DRAFT_653869 [Cenococcum geophilum 1.58]
MGDSAVPDPSQALKDKNLIEEFVKNYKNTIQTWHEVTRLARDLCLKNQRPGIQARFEFRVKDPESLKNKLIQRDEAKRKEPGRNGLGYRDEDEIWNDVYDRAGVRILLYTSAQPQKDAVRETIESTFVQAMLPKQFPESENGNGQTHEKAHARRFPKYIATHYRVYLKKDHIKQLEDNNVKDLWQGKYMVEIQVVSVFQHACAEVSHDILYKTKSGTPSAHEERVLDALNGVSMIGESLLEQLHYHYVTRIESTNQPFTNKFQLGDFLSKWTSQKSATSDLVLGPIEVLRKLLVSQDKATPKELEKILLQLAFGDEVRQSEAADGRVSIYIMEQMFREIPDTIIAHEDVELQGKIMASTMIWLDELYSPSTKWGTNFLNKNHPKNAKQREGFIWLMNETEGGQFLVYGVEPSPEEKENLAELWRWFEGHPEAIVQFVLRVSKLDQRDLKKDSEILEKIAPLLGQLDGSNTSAMSQL